MRGLAILAEACPVVVIYSVATVTELSPVAEPVEAVEVVEAIEVVGSVGVKLPIVFIIANIDEVILTDE